MKRLSLLGLAVIILFTAPLWLVNCSVIDQGMKGAKVDLYGGEKGEVSEVGPGAHWYNPVGTHFIELPVYTQTYSYVADPNEETTLDQSFKAVSSDNMSFQVGLAIHYSVASVDGCAAEIYRKYKTGNFRRISSGPVYDILRGQTKNIFSQYQAEEIYGSERPKVIQRVSDSTRKVMKNRVSVPMNGKRVGCFSVDQINLAELDAPNRLEEAVQKKMEAQQEAEEAKARLRQQEIDSRKDSIRAAQQAENNRMLAESIDDQVLRHKMIEVIRDKWDGSMPLVVSGGNSNGMGALLDMKTLQKAKNNR